jgi:uncharacterized protein
MLLIDGYNLLGALGLWSRVQTSDGEAVREELVLRLKRYAQQKRCEVTVVFDAWQQKGRLRQVEHRSGVTVIYSESGKRADQVIQELVRSGRQEVAVVSSDFEIVATARANGSLIVRSEEFSIKLGRAGDSSRQVSGHPVGYQPKDSDAKDSDERSRSPGKKGNPRKLPKKVRQRNRIMKRF